MDFFFKQNIQSETSTMMLWEASKAFFRGMVIRYAANQKKERTRKFQQLKDSLSKNEMKLK